MREGVWAHDDGGSGREVRVERVEEFKGDRKWKRFGCHVLGGELCYDKIGWEFGARV